MNIRKIIKKLEKIGSLRTVNIETDKNEVTVTFNDGIITKTRAAKNEFVKAVDEQFRGKGYNYMIDFREGICYLTVIEKNFSHMLDALRSMRIYVDPANIDSNPVAYTFYSPYPLRPKGNATNPKDAINNQKPQ
ncbi:hypothetical protein CMU68_10565 [Elizabethkingia anophelis]|nr:hypothetical protein [Elizabethkingia anophelis]MDV3585635.1 hypothetical protein [Elizabethkingia anophelis]MDV3678804.1 hypothetical protein [Elizabethkingia anophelis]